ncbi:hypothetical protein Cgig2_008490 [Carnegiea gigantea]|uniref:Peptidase S8/S53 domain-containing protein n=1 Tax=Carnegiea gigantea TaxID=171969 RepID=A0A9Q1K9N0_9CARY|nr:hypothetical protein Cgig2_008490 [Carnegiea gigantea]
MGICLRLDWSWDQHCLDKSMPKWKPQGSPPEQGWPFTKYARVSWGVPTPIYKDGVDVLSISIGGPPQKYADDLGAIGLFQAIEKGVFVSASGGNSGSGSSTIVSTIDHNFSAQLVLGNGVILSGTSICIGKLLGNQHYLPIVLGEDVGDVHCISNFSHSNLVNCKIVICKYGPYDYSGVPKGLIVEKTGGIGVVIPNDECYAITYSAYNKLVSYLKSTQLLKVKFVFQGTHSGIGAEFLSRGPNLHSVYVLKPDIITSRVDILAAWPTEVSPSKLVKDPRRSEFNVISGTYMACPYVFSVAALIKHALPDWSPAMIKLALMTAAYNHCHDDGRPLVDQASNKDASIWDFGAESYIEFLVASKYPEGEIRTIVKRDVSCGNWTSMPWDLNYPIIVVVFNQSGQFLRLWPQELSRMWVQRHQAIE